MLRRAIIISFVETKHRRQSPVVHTQTTSEIRIEKIKLNCIHRKFNNRRQVRSSKNNVRKSSTMRSKYNSCLGEYSALLCNRGRLQRVIVISKYCAHSCIQLRIKERFPGGLIGSTNINYLLSFLQWKWLRIIQFV